MPITDEPFAAFVIREGCAAFTASDATIEASGDQFLVDPAVVPHMIVNTGSGRHRKLDIYTSDRFV